MTRISEPRRIYILEPCEDPVPCEEPVEAPEPEREETPVPA